MTITMNTRIVAGNTLYVADQEGTDDSNKLAAGALDPRRLQHLRIFRRCSRPPGSN